MKSRTAFKILLLAILAFIAEITWTSVLGWGSYGPRRPIAGELIAISIMVTIAIIIASAISGIIGVIVKKKRVPLWLFWGLLLSVFACHAYLIIHIE